MKQRQSLHYRHSTLDRHVQNVVGYCNHSGIDVILAFNDFDTFLWDFMRASTIVLFYKIKIKVQLVLTTVIERSSV